MNVLDKLDALLSGLDAKSTADLDKLLAEELRKPWLPTPGPQLEAFLSPADLLLYGGAAGGGKTDLICGLALTEHERTVVFRRQANDLDGFWERLTQICQAPRHRDANKKKLTTQDGRLVECGHLDMPGSELSWQGRPHDLICVEKNTPVLMGDGSYKPVQCLHIGDMVHTLEGPRPITKVFPPQFKAAVEISALDESGRIIASQVQGSTHELLTSAGWVCLDKSSSSRRAWFSKSTECPSSCKDAELSVRPYVQPSYNQGDSSFHPPHIAEQWQVLQRLARSFARGTCVFEVPEYAGNGCARTDDLSQGWQPPLLSNALRALREAALPLAGVVRKALRSVFSCDARGALKRSLSQGYQARCLCGIHPCDERTRGQMDLRSELGGVQLYLHQSSDVAPPNPNGSAKGGRDRIRGCSRRIESYTHPYTRETRQIQAQLTACSSFSISDVGVKELYDLEVSELNHYITKGGFINRNCFDEGAQLTAYKVKFVLGWLRSASAKRCRAVIASNPPIGGDGAWLVEWFAPWLDPMFAKPAKPGELRWAVAVGDGDQVTTVWVEGPEPVEINGEMVTPLSRTFIPSKLDDNPYLKETNYRAQLQSMPEPMRSQLLNGDFLAGRQDDEWQVIPSAWVREAQARWPGAPKTAMKSMGVDIAQGGPDQTAIARLHEPAHFAEMEAKAGADTPDGPSAAAFVLKLRRDSASIGIDTTGGWGGSARDHLKTHHEITAVPVVFSAAGNGRDKATKLEYHNLRAQIYWELRNALDPESGEDVILPPGARILAQLTAAHWKPRSGKILIESKEEIKTRLGASPDEADAIVIAWHLRNRKVREATRTKLPKPRLNLPLQGHPHSWTR